MTIPPPVLVVVADALALSHSWSKLDMLFTVAGCPGEAPDGSNKAARCMHWLRRLNAEMPENALEVLGRLLQRFMEEEVRDTARPWGVEGGLNPAEEREAQRARVNVALNRAGLTYSRGGHVTLGGTAVAAKQLHELIRERRLPAIEAEFETLAQRVAAHPRDALSAAANILEATLGKIVSAWNLMPPGRRTLNTLWMTVKPAINADPSTMPDPDLAKIAGAMGAMVDGLQGLRDDKSRAHAMKPELARAYRIEPRHARLAVNSALALTVFLLDAWEAKDRRAQSVVPSRPPLSS